MSETRSLLRHLKAPWAIMGFIVTPILGGCSVWQGGTVPPAVVNAEVHRGAETLAFNQSSTRLASGGWDGKVALWRLDQTQPERIWHAHDNFVYGVAFSGDHLVSAGRDGTLRVWDEKARAVLERDTGSPISRMVATDERVITGHTDGQVMIWAMPGLEAAAKHTLHTGEVSGVAVDAATGRLASIGYDGKVYVFEGPERPRALADPPGAVRSITFGENGRLFAGGWRKIYRWDDDGAIHTLSTAHWGLIAGLHPVRGGNTIASISRVMDSSVFLVDPEDGSTVHHFKRQSICGGAISASPNGRFIATTGDDGIVRIFDLSDLHQY